MTTATKQATSGSNVSLLEGAPDVASCEALVGARVLGITVSLMSKRQARARKPVNGASAKSAALSWAFIAYIWQTR